MMRSDLKPIEELDDNILNYIKINYHRLHIFKTYNPVIKKIN